MSVAVSKEPSQKDIDSFYHQYQENGGNLPDVKDVMKNDDGLGLIGLKTKLAKLIAMKLLVERDDE